VSRFVEVAPAPAIETRLLAIEEHLTRIAAGHDPRGHLFAVERLARATRSDWAAIARVSLRERAGR
jgi:hypothetical protein